MGTLLLVTLTAALAAPLSLPLTAQSHEAPRPRRDIVQTAVEAGNFETLAAALGAADLVGALQGEGPFTVFAPTDDAFAKVDAQVLQYLLTPAGRDALESILTYHVVSGAATAADAIAAGSVETLQGSSVDFRIANGRLQVNESNVVINDLAASNGIIHVIDTVLLPPDLELPDLNGRLVIGVFTERPGKALATQLDLDRNGSLLITGIVDGSNAESAGLSDYDVVYSIDGHPATDATLKSAKQAKGVGGLLELGILRRGERKTVHVAVGVERH